MYDKRDTVIAWMTDHGLPEKESYNYPFAGDYTIDVKDEFLAVLFKLEFSDYYQITVVL
jgi:hypothetical protein